MADLSKFDVPGIVKLDKGEGGFDRVVITGRQASGEMYLHGAHVTAWTPRGQKPVLFMSAASSFENGKPIRGGIPVIFPWFGPRKGYADSPIHGLARTTSWSLADVHAETDGAVSVSMELTSSDATQILWPHSFSLRLTATFGESLKISLTVTNTGAGEFSFEEALHTYFSVGDVHQISITGLEGATFIDKTDGGSRKAEGNAAVTVSGETDRVYLATKTTCTINDPSMSRKIIVAKEGSDATVVWNPWTAKAKAMADFGDEEWPEMVCVETVNAGDHTVKLAAGQRHVMSAEVQVA